METTNETHAAGRMLGALGVGHLRSRRRRELKHARRERWAAARTFEREFGRHHRFEGDSQSQ